MARTQKTTPVHKSFESRRKFPRLIMNIPAIVTGAGGKRFKATLYDLSPDGAQIRYLIKDGINLFPDKNTSVKDIKALQCILQFKLSYEDRILQIKINARPVYLRSISEDTLAAGILFEEDQAENQVIKDFLLSQLEASFTELNKLKTNTTETKARKQTTKSRKEPDPPEKKILLSLNPEEKITDTDYSRNDLQSLKHDLAQITGSLKVIQETTRHIDERIYVLEQMLHRRS